MTSTTLPRRIPLQDEAAVRARLEVIARQVWPEFERLQVAETPNNLQEPGGANRFLVVLLMRVGTQTHLQRPSPLQRITKGPTAMIALQRMFENIDEARRRGA